MYIGAYIYTKQKLTDLQREINKSSLIVGNCITLLSMIDRKSRKLIADLWKTWMAMQISVYFKGLISYKAYSLTTMEFPRKQ